jgi:hypothetical protein
LLHATLLGQSDLRCRLPHLFFKGLVIWQYFLLLSGHFLNDLSVDLDTLLQPVLHVLDQVHAEEHQGVSLLELALLLLLLVLTLCH